MDACIELDQLLLAHDVRERHHRPAVLHLRELVARLRSHALGGRIGRAELRICRLQFGQLAEEAVVLGVRDRRRVEDVIAVVGLAELLAQLVGAFGDAHRGANVTKARQRRGLFCALIEW